MSSLTSRIESIVDRLSTEWIMNHSGMYEPLEGSRRGRMTQLLKPVWLRAGEPQPDPYYPPAQGGVRVIWLLFGQRIGYVRFAGHDVIADAATYAAVWSEGIALCEQFRAEEGHNTKFLPMLWTLEAVPPHLR